MYEPKHGKHVIFRCFFLQFVQVHFFRAYDPLSFFPTLGRIEELSVWDGERDLSLREVYP